MASKVISVYTKDRWKIIFIVIIMHIFSIILPVKKSYRNNTIKYKERDANHEDNKDTG